MNAILGFTNLLMKEELSDGQHEKLQYVQDAGMSLLSLINSMLDFSKLTAGEMRLSSAPFFAARCNRRGDGVRAGGGARQGTHRPLARRRRSRVLGARRSRSLSPSAASPRRQCREVHRARRNFHRHAAGRPRRANRDLAHQSSPTPAQASPRNAKMSYSTTSPKPMAPRRDASADWASACRSAGETGGNDGRPDRLHEHRGPGSTFWVAVRFQEASQRPNLAPSSRGAASPQSYRSSAAAPRDHRNFPANNTDDAMRAILQSLASEDFQQLESAAHRMPTCCCGRDLEPEPTTPCASNWRPAAATCIRPRPPCENWKLLSKTNISIRLY